MWDAVRRYFACLRDLAGALARWGDNPLHKLRLASRTRAGAVAAVPRLLIESGVALVLASIAVRLAIRLANRGFVSDEAQRLLATHWGASLVFLMSALAVWCAFLFVRGVGAALAFLGTGKAARGVLVLDEPLAVSPLSDAELLVGAAAPIVRPLWLPLGVLSLLLWFTYFMETIAGSSTPAWVVALAAAVALPCCLAASYLACWIWILVYACLGRGHGAWAFALGSAVLTVVLTAGFLVESRVFWENTHDWLPRYFLSEVVTGVSYACAVAVAVLVLLLESASQSWHARSTVALTMAACLPGILLAACTIPDKLLGAICGPAVNSVDPGFFTRRVCLVMDMAAAVFVAMALLFGVALLCRRWLLGKVALAAALLVLGMSMGAPLESLETTWVLGVQAAILLPVGGFALVNPLAGPRSQWLVPQSWIPPAAVGGLAILDWLRGPATILMQIGLLLVIAPYALAAVRDARAGFGAGSGRGGS